MKYKDAWLYWHMYISAKKQLGEFWWFYIAHFFFVFRPFIKREAPSTQKKSTIPQLGLRYFHSIPLLSWMSLGHRTSLQRFVLVCLITMMVRGSETSWKGGEPGLKRQGVWVCVRVRGPFFLCWCGCGTGWKKTILRTFIEEEWTANDKTVRFKVLKG